MRTRVVLVEEVDEVRQLYRKFLEPESDIEVVGEAADWREGLRLCEELTPDVVVTGLARCKPREPSF